MITDCLDIRRRFNTWPARRIDKIDMVVVHRNSIGTDAYTVAEWYQSNPKWAGPRMPYHFVICADGQIQQAVELGYRCNHAAGRNARSIGISLIGDLRKTAPTGDQVFSLHRLLVLLQDGLGPLSVHRHRAKGKYACPGGLLPVEEIADRVNTLREERAAKGLIQAGVRV